MATIAINVPVEGIEIDVAITAASGANLVADTRYSVENSGDNPILIIEATSEPSDFGDSAGTFLLPRPYWPSPSRKLHTPGVAIISKASDNFYMYGIKGPATAVVNLAP